MISRLINLIHCTPRLILNQEPRRYKSSRPEQLRLRKFLLDNKEMKCIICQKNHFKYLLECTHIKPRYLSSDRERNDVNIVNWMCRNCHKYDIGDITIDEGILIKNDFINEYDFQDNFNFEEYERSGFYFKFHKKKIFLSNK